MPSGKKKKQIENDRALDFGEVSNFPYGLKTKCSNGMNT